MSGHKKIGLQRGLRPESPTGGAGIDSKNGNPRNRRETWGRNNGRQRGLVADTPMAAAGSSSLLAALDAFAVAPGFCHTASIHSADPSASYVFAAGRNARRNNRNETSERPATSKIPTMYSNAPTPLRVANSLASETAATRVRQARMRRRSMCPG